MQVSAYLKLSVAVALATIVHEDRRLVGDRLGQPAVGRAGVAGQPGRRDVRAADGDHRGAAGRRRPSLRPPQGRVLLQRLRRRAHPGGGAGHHLGGGAALFCPAAAGEPGLGPGPEHRQFRDERRTGLGHAAQGTRASVDGAGGRCTPPVHRCLDFGRRRARAAGRGRHRLVMARPAGGHRRGAATSCARGCRWSAAPSMA